MDNLRENLRLIWADKIVLVIGISVLALTGIGWLLVAIAAGIAGADHVVASFVTEEGVYTVFSLAVFWLFLRGADFVFRGSTYRLFANRRPSAWPPSRPVSSHTKWWPRTDLNGHVREDNGF